MTQAVAGEAVSKTYLVTVVETYRVEADSEDEAITQADELRRSGSADTVDLQVEEVAR